VDVYLGETGLDETFQEPFPPTTKCLKCKGEARIMFVVAEEGGGAEDKYLSSLHKNGGEGDYWVHDACAIAIYLCKKCFTANALINQA